MSFKSPCCLDSSSPWGCQQVSDQEQTKPVTATALLTPPPGGPLNSCWLALWCRVSALWPLRHAHGRSHAHLAVLVVTVLMLSRFGAWGDTSSSGFADIIHSFWF